MKTRAAVVLAVLLGLLVPALPASAAAPATTLSGRVLDESGHPVAGTTVRAELEIDYTAWQAFADGLGDAFGCLFSFGLACDLGPDRAGAVARTGRDGRYVLRYDPTWRYWTETAYHVRVTGPTLVPRTEPATTTMDVAPLPRSSMPTVRLWMHGPSLDPVGGTKRRLRAGVPSALGRPKRPANVELVQGYATVWSYGEVARDRDVDTRVAEEGVTGTQATVTTRVGSVDVSYLSAVRRVTNSVMPLSRGHRCYGDDVVLDEIPDCPLTDRALASGLAGKVGQVIVDLGGLSTPDAYVVRGCTVTAVAASVEGEVYLDVDVTQPERGVWTGSPLVPVRYVRVSLAWCKPAEVSLFGTPLTLPSAQHLEPLVGGDQAPEAPSVRLGGGTTGVEGDDHGASGAAGALEARAREWVARHGEALRRGQVEPVDPRAVVGAVDRDGLPGV